MGLSIVLVHFFALNHFLLIHIFRDAFQLQTGQIEVSRPRTIFKLGLKTFSITIGLAILLIILQDRPLPLVLGYTFQLIIFILSIKKNPIL